MMVNDIWYLGKGHWAAYTEDSSVAEQLHNLSEVQLVTVYRHLKKNDILAMQFTFFSETEQHPNQCLLSLVCSLMGLNFRNVLLMEQRGDSLPYSRRYYPEGDQVQLLFDSYSPKKKKTQSALK